MYASITSLLTPDLSSAIFHTLLHSLWQIPVIALGIKLLSQNRKLHTALDSYHANFGAIVMSILVAGFTFIYYLLKKVEVLGVHEQGLFTATPSPNSSLLTDAQALLPESLSWSEWLMQNDTSIVLLWSAGVVLLLGRIFAGWIGLHYMKQELRFDIPEELISQFKQIKHRLGINQGVRLALSSVSTIPLVIGHLKPIVLLPVATLNELSNEEVEAILIHELAHILQYDFVKNLIVMVGESLFFYHPVIWMLSSEIKEEREHCCDDTVMRLCPNRIQYARTLLKLEELHIGNASGLTMALFNSKFKLMKRVKRILNMQSDSRNAKIKITIVALLMGSLIVFSSADLINKGSEIKSLKESVNTENADLNFSKNVDVPVLPDLPVTPIIPKFTDRIPSSVNFESSNKVDNVVRALTTDVILPVVDTLDKEERAELQRKLKEKRKEIKEKTREIRDKMKVQRDKIRSEYKEDLDKKRKELRKLRKELRKEGHTYNFNGEFDFDFNEEEIEEWGEKMGEWGARFGAKIASTFDDQWVAEMSETGDDMGDIFNEEWSEKWKDYGEKLGADMAEIFDDEWVESMTDLGEDISSSFDEEWLEGIADLSDEISRAVSEAMEHVNIEDLNYNYTTGDVDNSQELKSRLVEVLNSEGLLTDQKNTIIIKDNEMIVNGKPQPVSRLKYYHALIKENSSRAFEEGETTVKFVLHGKTLEGSKRTSLSVDIDN